MNEIRYVVLGNVDSAKSTLIGTICNDILDNGRGLARQKVFVHKHELDSGRTSSIAIKYKKINENKFLSFIDLAGHEKYLKTTLHGINSSLADYAILLIGANMGITKMTKEHLGIIKALKIPFVVVISKIDICPKNVLDTTISNISKIIEKNFKKKKIIDPNKKIDSDSIAIFKISNVTGEGLDNLKKYIFDSDNINNWDECRQKDTIFWIDNSYYVKGIGIVLSGIVKNGDIRVNDKLLLGPVKNSKEGFYEIIVKSIHDNFRNLIPILNSGCSGCINIKSINKKEIITKKIIKKGMVMIHTNFINNERKLVREFEAKVTILHHPTTIKTKYEPVIHCGKISQSAYIKYMDKENIRTGDTSNIIFKFKYRPEFLEKDDVLMFREGRTKGYGIITQILK